MARLNRTCYACQTKYSYCPSCSRADAARPSWASEFCSESCKDLWMALTKYNMAMLSKSDAKSIISNLDLKPIDVYSDRVQRDYNKIMEQEKKPKRGKRIEIKSINEIVNIEQPIEVVDPMVIEPIIEQPIEVAESHEVVLEENK